MPNNNLNYHKLVFILMSDDVITNINHHLEELLSIIPEIKDMINFPHNHPHHHLDVWEHTLFALSLSPMGFAVRIALLLHDIGKPHSYQDGQVRHFKGHPQVSADMAQIILKRLNFSDEEITKICYLIATHDEPINDQEIDDDYHLTITKFKIQFCDAMAHNPTKLEKRAEYLLAVIPKLYNPSQQKTYKKLVLNTLSKITSRGIKYEI